ncbi:PIN domain-containing protein [Mesorhizobium sp. NPDC059054]|uniref:PIN domain-containing protein n=1 Tax=Mesorhizobium sp. NPDC059054 TaxID=3346711 RepID=UPI0036A59314
MYILDTNIVSEFQRQKPNPQVLSWLAAAPARSLAISFSAVFEVQRGIESLAQRDSCRASELSQWLDELLETDIHYVDADARTARLYAAMTSVPSLSDLWMPRKDSKKQAPGQDLLIAATAIACGAVVVTINVRDFVRIDRHFPLPGLFNPVTSSWIIVPHREQELAGRPDKCGGAGSKNAGPIEAFMTLTSRKTSLVFA